MEAITQEHERTVSAARIGMSFHDGKSPLARWFNNYKEDKDAMFFSAGWAVVSRDGRRWKVDFGRWDEEVPWSTSYADPRAPEPPLFEFRPPKPEPVKPRFNVREAQRVMGYDRGGIDYSTIARWHQEVSGLSPRLLSGYGEPRSYRYYDRDVFDRIATPPPPPPTRRNQ